MPAPLSDLPRLRIELAGALRWAARLGLHESICNHFSVALEDESFLVNGFGVHWSAIRASDILRVARDGTVLEGARTVEATAFFIHKAIHQACPQATAVMHTHMPNATALCCVQGARIEPIHQNALRFQDRIAFGDAYDGLGETEEAGTDIARQLGNKSILMHPNHGPFVTGASIAEAFDDLYFLERVAELQLKAMASGAPLLRVDAGAARKTAAQFAAGGSYAAAHFQALLDILDRDEPAYRD